MAVKTADCSFVVAPENCGSALYANDAVIIPGCDSEIDGISNTDALIRYNGTSWEHAALLARQYSFANGKSGYLGAKKEWDALNRFFDEVNNLLTIMNAVCFTPGHYRSSTQAQLPNTYDLFVSAASGKITHNVTTFFMFQNAIVRPFCPLF